MKMVDLFSFNCMHLPNADTIQLIHVLSLYKT